MTPARWTAAALAVLAVAVYANATANGFALDDHFIIVDNPRVHGTDRLVEVVTEPYWPDSPDRLGLYRPLTAASYAIEWELWGGDPMPFHITNILLHALATVLVFLLVGAVTGVRGAAVGAAVFAVHPVHVEAVANVVGRAELMASVFVLAAAVLYLRGGLSRSRARLWGGAAVIALAYLLGLLSKEIAVTLPGLLLVLEAGRGGRRSDGTTGAEPAGHPDPEGAGAIATAIRRALDRWPVFVGLGIGLGAYLGIRTAVLGTTVGNDAAGYLQALDPVERVMTAVALWPEYLRLMVFPLELVADYSPGVLTPADAFGPRVLVGLLVGALLVLVTVYSWRRARGIAVGILFFAVAVLPVSNLIIPVGILLAERTLYLPSVGLALAVAGAWRWLEARRAGWRPVATAAVVVVLVLAGARTWVRTPSWKSTGTVMATLARDHPESFRVQWLMADQLRQQGRLDQALQRYRRATQLEPSHYRLRVQYGVALLEARRLQDAARAFRTARDAVPENAEAHILLMAALLEAGEPARAAAAGREALRWQPDHRGIHHQLAIALTRTGDPQGALHARRESIRLGGERAAWTQFLHEAELLLRMDRMDAAREALTRARERAPETVPVPTLDRLREAIRTADVTVLPYR
ncbi:MAG: tetratricopeptide repeat protein [Longimicrobiales bacterium]|nr:tetratricopeptide repeat protein [Longimicrobiales bacterium]